MFGSSFSFFSAAGCFKRPAAGVPGYFHSVTGTEMRVGHSRANDAEARVVVGLANVAAGVAALLYFLHLKRVCGCLAKCFGKVQRAVGESLFVSCALSLVLTALVWRGRRRMALIYSAAASNLLGTDTTASASSSMPR